MREQRALTEQQQGLVAGRARSAKDGRMAVKYLPLSGPWHECAPHVESKAQGLFRALVLRVLSLRVLMSGHSRRKAEACKPAKLH